MAILRHSPGRQASHGGPKWSDDYRPRNHRRSYGDRQRSERGRTGRNHSARRSRRRGIPQHQTHAFSEEVIFMNISRRVFLGSVAAVPAAAWLFAAGQAHAPKIGVTDWNLKKTGDLDAVALAKSLGFEGVQVSLGRKPVD